MRRRGAWLPVDLPACPALADVAPPGKKIKIKKNKNKMFTQSYRDCGEGKWMSKENALCYSKTDSSKSQIRPYTQTMWIEARLFRITALGVS